MKEAPLLQNRGHICAFVFDAEKFWLQFWLQFFCKAII